MAEPLPGEGAQPCNLCAALTPRALLRPEAFQEWDALCPTCWEIATRQTARELASGAAQTRRADASRDISV